MFGRRLVELKKSPKRLRIFSRFRADPGPWFTSWCKKIREKKSAVWAQLTRVTDRRECDINTRSST